MSVSAPKLPDWVRQLNSAKRTDALTPDQQSRIDSAKAYAQEISSQLLLRKPELEKEMAEMDAAQNSSYWLENIGIFCRIYIGSLNYDVLEAHLRAVFGVYGHVVSVALSYEPLESRHKGFSFIEFDTPEAATTSIQWMDGALLGGRNIRVGRPQQYPSEGSKCLPAAPKSRIYISNIHEVVTEDDLREIFSGYGAIKAVSLPAADSSGRKHKSYAFVEFESASAAGMAIQSLHDFELGGLKLKISRAILGGELEKSVKAGPIQSAPASVVSLAESLSSSASALEKNQ